MQSISARRAEVCLYMWRSGIKRMWGRFVASVAQVLALDALRILRKLDLDQVCMESGKSPTDAKGQEIKPLLLPILFLGGKQESGYFL